jgi:exopolysaccharide production protein ExoQ
MSTSASWTIRAAQDVSMPSWRFWLWTLVIGIAFFTVDQNPRILESDSWDEEVYSVEEFGERIASGNSLRQGMFMSLGLLGVWGLARREGRTLDWGDPLLLASTAFVAWAVLSTAWSTDSGLTMRRVIRLLCVYLAAIGVVRQFSPREFMRMVFVITLGWFAFSCALELLLGRFRPWITDYRFCGMMHPNTQVLHCAVLVLASIAILRGSARTDWFTRCVLLASGAAFLLTRSRTALVALVIALVVLRLAKPGVNKLPWLVACAVLISSVGVAAGFAGPSLDEKIANTLLLGRSEDAGSFTGRLPLWGELIHFAAQRPITGFGYGAFWDPERTETIADLLYVRGWSIPHAHSSYLDSLLALGLVGAGAMVTMVVLAWSRAIRQFRLLPDAANTFLIALLTFGAVDAVAECALIEPAYFYFLMICAVLQLTLRDGASVPGKHRLFRGHDPRNLLTN